MSKSVGDSEHFQDQMPQNVQLIAPSEELRQIAQELVKAREWEDRLRLVEQLRDLASVLEGRGQRALEAGSQVGRHAQLEVTELNVGLSVDWVPPEHKKWFSEVFVNIIRQVHQHAVFQTRRDFQRAVKQLFGFS